MSASNGIIRIGRKGKKKFAFGDEGTPGSEPFEVDVVGVFQAYVVLDEGFRPAEANADGKYPIPAAEVPEYQRAVREFVEVLRCGDVNLQGVEGYQPVTIAEALDFIARLREQYDELADFFQPKSRQERDSPATSEPVMRFSVEGAAPS